MLISGEWVCSPLNFYNKIWYLLFKLRKNAGQCRELGERPIPKGKRQKLNCDTKNVTLLYGKSLNRRTTVKLECTQQS